MFVRERELNECGCFFAAAFEIIKMLINIDRCCVNFALHNTSIHTQRNNKNIMLILEQYRVRVSVCVRACWFRFSSSSSFILRFFFLYFICSCFIVVVIVVALHMCMHRAYSFFFLFHFTAVLNMSWASKIYISLYIERNIFVT